MKPVEWSEIMRLYLEATDLRAEDQCAFLDRSCEQAPQLRQEIESLLAADRGRGTFLDCPPARLAADLLATNPGSLSAGQRVRGFEVESLCSVGGMGEVYFARNVVSREPVALKMLQQRFAADLHAVDRFEREARAASALNHPNIVGVYEFGTSELGLYIAMEWVDGVTWRDLMRPGGAELESAIVWARQAAGALAAAHEAGIVHRDIKPENMMLDKAGNAKILDFGLARLGGTVTTDVEAMGSSGTISGTLSGTLPYMPPELLLGELTTSASDVFSLGSVFYELFTGQHPFSGPTPLDVFAAIESGTPEGPSKVRAEISPALNELLLQMLSRDSESRPLAWKVAVALESMR